MPEAPTPGPASLAAQALAHVDALWATATRLCESEDDANDLVQEVFARSLASAARFQPGSNLKAWLFRILRNTYLDLARRKQYALEVQIDDLPADLVEEWTTPQLERLRYLTSSDIARVLAALPSEARFLVMLDAEGFSETEIADILRCAQGTVKSRLSRARQRMRAIVKENAP